MSGRGIAAVAAAVLAAGAGGALIVTSGDDDDGGDGTTTTSATTTTGTQPNPPLPAPFQPNMEFKEPPVIKLGDGPVRFTALNRPLEVSGIQVREGQTYVPADPPPGYEPSLLAPTLQVEPGERIEIALNNRLTVPEGMQDAGTCAASGEHHEGDDAPAPAPGNAEGQITNLHFHGLHVTPTTRKLPDGGTIYGENVLVDLKPGIVSNIAFSLPPITNPPREKPEEPRVKAPHERGTFWYHAHRHTCTDDQVYRGLAGLLIVGDVREDLPERFRNVETRSLALKDIQIEPANKGQKGPPYAFEDDHDWVNPTHRTVNGLVNPTMTMKPGETQLWRLANTSSAVWYDVTLVDESDKPDPFTVVAQDGSTLKKAQEEESVLMGPGMRYDILVTAPDSGKRTLKTLPFDQGREPEFPEDTLATVNIDDGEPEPAIDPPDALKPLAPYPKRRGEDREFEFNFVMGKGFINDKQFSDDPDSPPIATPELNTTETWTFTNVSGQWHPIHIHQDDYTVTSATMDGKPVGEPMTVFDGQQDVVPLPPQVGNTPGEVKIEFPFADFDGQFVIHCHILGHEDAGMMGRIDVSPDAPP